MSLFTKTGPRGRTCEEAVRRRPLPRLPLRGRTRRPQKVLIHPLPGRGELPSARMGGFEPLVDAVRDRPPRHLRRPTGSTARPRGRAAVPSTPGRGRERKHRHRRPGQRPRLAPPGGRTAAATGRDPRRPLRDAGLGARQDQPVRVGQIRDEQLGLGPERRGGLTRDRYARDRSAGPELRSGSAVAAGLAAARIARGPTVRSPAAAFNGGSASRRPLGPSRPTRGPISASEADGPDGPHGPRREPHAHHPRRVTARLRRHAVEVRLTGKRIGVPVRRTGPSRDSRCRRQPGGGAPRGRGGRHRRRHRPAATRRRGWDDDARPAGRARTVSPATPPSRPGHVPRTLEDVVRFDRRARQRLADFAVTLREGARGFDGRGSAPPGGRHAGRGDLDRHRRCARGTTSTRWSCCPTRRAPIDLVQPESFRFLLRSGGDRGFPLVKAPNRADDEFPWAVWFGGAPARRARSSRSRTATRSRAMRPPARCPSRRTRRSSDPSGRLSDQTRTESTFARLTHRSWGELLRAERR